MSLTRALWTFETAPARFEVGKAQLVLAEVGRELGDTVDAVRYIYVAYQAFSECRAPVYIQRAKQLAYTLGRSFAML